MGIVFEAYDHERGITVALKRLLKVDPHGIYRFKNEFRSLAGITHPNLVTLYELLSAADQWFFTMEFVEGFDFFRYARGDFAKNRSLDPSVIDFSPDDSTKGMATTTTGEDASGDTPAPARLDPDSEMLRQVRKTTSPPDYHRLRQGLRQLVEGICVLHDNGYLHRDIKPSNVLVTREGRVVLLDFGVITELAGKLGFQDRFEIVGTPAYIPPEVVVAGSPPSPAGDWYAVGMMMFEALTGWRPFRGSLKEVKRAKTIVDLPEPISVLPEIPEDLNDLCRDLVRFDPAQRPAGAEIIERLRQSRRRVISDAMAPTPNDALEGEEAFIGREQHLAALRSAFADTQKGRSVIVKVHGNSGIGKSALAWFFLNQLVDGGEALVLAGRCHEWESVPYKAVDSVIDTLVRHLMQMPRYQLQQLLPPDIAALVRLFPVLQRVPTIAELCAGEITMPDRRELRLRAFAVLRTLMKRMAEDRRVILFIDDLQWGDVDSAPLLTSLMRQPNGPALLLLLCYRSGDVNKSILLRELLRPESPFCSGDHVREVSIGPLPRSEGQELAKTLLRRAGHEGLDADGVAREARGNPYFIQELVHYASSNPLARPSSWGPLTLEEAINARVVKLPKPARRMLEVVAVAGRPVSQRIVTGAAELTEEHQPAIALLRSARLVRTMGAREADFIETYHDRIRESVVGHLPRAVLQSNHLALARQYEISDQSDFEALCTHFLSAGVAERASHYAVRAADHAAETLAFDRAADLYRLALEQRPHGEKERHLLGAKLGDSLANAGRCHEAGRVYLDAVTGASASQALEMQRRAAVQFLISGHMEEGFAALSNVLQRVGLKLAKTATRALFSFVRRRLQIWLRGRRYTERDPNQSTLQDLTRIDVCWSVAMGLAMVDPIRAWDFQARNLLLSLRAGDPYRIGRALAFESAYTALKGGAASALISKVLHECETITRRVDNQHLKGLYLLGKGMSQHLQGHYRIALECVDRAEDIFRGQCTGVEWELDTAHSVAIWALFYMGRISELNRRFAVLSQEAQAQGDILALLNLGSYGIFSAMLQTDEPEEARQGLLELVENLSQRYYQITHANCLIGRVSLELYCGEGPAALDLVTREWPSIKKARLMRIQKLRGNLYYLRARAALAAAKSSDDPRPLLRIAERDARRLARERHGWIDPLAHLIQASIAAFRRDTSEAIARLEVAEMGFAAVDMALHAASARRRRGELIEGDQGRGLIDSADRSMTELGIRNPKRATVMQLGT